MIKKMNLVVHHHPITLIEVKNGKGLDCTLCSFGASLYSLKIKGRSILCNFKTFRKFMYTDAFYGKTVGRTAGRIKNGIFTLNNKEYHLKNAFNHALHGGFGFSFKNFDVKTEEDEKTIKVIFECLSPDMEKGFPGNMEVKVTYEFSKEKNQFSIIFDTVSDQDTLCSMTNHSYFNLEGDLHHSILKEKMLINADQYVIPTIPDLLFDSIQPVNDTFDFTKEREVGSHILDKVVLDTANGYDHDYLLNHREGDDFMLTSEDESLKMTINTTNPVLHIYTGNHLSYHHDYFAIAVECEREIFNVDKVILKKNEPYHEVTTYTFMSK